MPETPVYSDSIERFLDLILETRYEDLPPEAIEAGKVFFLDTVGVACAGKLAPKGWPANTKLTCGYLRSTWKHMSRRSWACTKAWTRSAS